MSEYQTCKVEGVSECLSMDGLKFSLTLEGLTPVIYHLIFTVLVIVER